ncbi:MAG TPA: hypothetical protein VK575_06115, partial [Gemmatimonadaceae bacterium]|nr:hypothetical protein [Gemmatimonadaceae bacterium]
MSESAPVLRLTGRVVHLTTPVSDWLRNGPSDAPVTTPLTATMLPFAVEARLRPVAELHSRDYCADAILMRNGSAR